MNKYQELTNIFIFSSTHSQIMHFFTSRGLLCSSVLIASFYQNWNNFPYHYFIVWFTFNHTRGLFRSQPQLFCAQTVIIRVYRTSQTSSVALLANQTVLYASIGRQLTALLLLSKLKLQETLPFPKPSLVSFPNRNFLMYHFSVSFMACKLQLDPSTLKMLLKLFVLLTLTLNY